MVVRLDPTPWFIRAMPPYSHHLAPARLFRPNDKSYKATYEPFRRKPSPADKRKAAAWNSGYVVDLLSLRPLQDI